MKDYAKMIETVRAIQETFGSSEFTRKEYVTNIEKKNLDAYSANTALSDERFVVKKTREEDYIVKTADGKKVIGTRYFYEVNQNFIDALKEDLAKEANDIEDQMVKLSAQIAKLQQKKEKKQAMLDMLSKLCK